MLYLSESSSVKKEEFTLLQNEEESTAIISQCTQPQEHIVFHKTHKCSSSTIQNILLRYSKNHRSLNHLLLLKRVFPFLVDALNGTNHWRNGSVKIGIGTITQMRRVTNTDLLFWVTILQKPLSE